MLRAQCNADRRTDRDLGTREIERLGKREQHAAPDPRGLDAVAKRAEKHGEFVTRQSPDQGGRTAWWDRHAFGDRTQPVGNHPEQHVATGMSHRIVDSLETIQIDKEQCPAPARAGADRRLDQQAFARAPEVGAVGKTRDRIKHGEAVNTVEIGIQLFEQALHCRRELRHVYGDFRGNLAA